MPTLNEAPQVSRAIGALDWADEVIVVDGGSTDDTPALARAAGARVLIVAGKTIAAQRNAGSAAARNRWVLALDADEQVTPELRWSLTRLCAASPLQTAFRVRSRNWHLGRELLHGPWGSDWKVRVFTRERRFANVRVHEHLEALDDVGSLEGALLHRPYRDMAHQVIKIGTYARWAAEDMHARGRRARMSDLLVRPAWRFMRDYLIMSGWRDGVAGFIVSVTSAFSVFAKYAALLTRDGRTGER